MAVTLSSVIATVRGIVLDRVDDAISPLFTDEEIAKAVNSTVGGFFGVRPEAFSPVSISTDPPDEFSGIGKPCLGFPRVGPYVDFSGISAALLGYTFDAGNISLDFKTDRAGALFFFGDPVEHTALLVEATGLRLINSLTPLSLQLLGAFTDNKWHTVEISQTGGAVTMTVGSEASTAAHGGSLIYDTSRAYLGRALIGAAEYGFQGYLSELVFEDEDRRPLIRYSMDEGSGSTLFNSAVYGLGPPAIIRIDCSADAAFSGVYTFNVDRWERAGWYSVWKDVLWYLSNGPTTFHAPDNGLDTPPAAFYRTLDYPETGTVVEALAATVSLPSATVYGSPVEWIEDEPLGLARWAVQQFCYGVAAFLLMQRGKDAFYREAADALQKLYTGR